MTSIAHRLYGNFPKLGVPVLGGPYNKDYSILGSILRFPLFWESYHIGCGFCTRGLEIFWLRLGV